MLSWEDDEFAQVVNTFTEARKALAQARIARGFYLVVVPASSGTQPRFGRGAGRQRKRRGKGQGGKTRKLAAKQKGKSSSSSIPPPHWGRPDRPPGVTTVVGGRPSPICFRCGKKGHLSANCTNAPNAKGRKLQTQLQWCLI